MPCVDRLSCNMCGVVLPLFVPAATQDLPFMADVEERKPGFLKQVKSFFKETDGGAVPVSVAKAALGYSHSHIYTLMAREKEEAGTGLRAWKFGKTVLICAKDIDRMADEKKIQRGYQKPAE